MCFGRFLTPRRYTETLDIASFGGLDRMSIISSLHHQTHWAVMMILLDVVSERDADHESRNDGIMTPEKWDHDSRKMPQTCLKDGPKMCQTWPKDGRKMVQTWSKHGPNMPQTWSKDAPNMTQRRSKHGPNMAQTWPKDGPNMVQT